MPYRVRLTETVRAAVAHFHPELKELTRRALAELAENPLLGKELQEELAGYFSYRFKRYRVIYTVDDGDGTVVVHLVWHRRNVYELLERIARPEGRT
ncbi:MAG: type II toxin-antitoxin system RelE/ParE family toxin [Thermodesulfobacteriota bacterium]